MLILIYFIRRGTDLKLEWSCYDQYWLNRINHPTASHVTVGWGRGGNYNMTVWILAGNYISFTIAAGLIRLHMPGVKKSRV